MNSQDIASSMLGALIERDFDKAHELLDKIKEHSKDIKVYEKKEIEFLHHKSTWNHHYHIHVSNKVFHRIIDEILVFVHGGRTKKKEET